MRRIIRVLLMALCFASIGYLPTKAEEVYTAKATAYCITGTTASGTYTKDNHTVASKREWFGKVMILYLDTGDHQIHPENYIGTYTIEDTGSDAIQKGYVIDVYIPSYEKCKEFGRKSVVFQLIDGEG